jgi:hypothetical protein
MRMSGQPDIAFRDQAMKLNCYRDTDSLYIDLSVKSSAERREVSEGVLRLREGRGESK